MRYAICGCNYPIQLLHRGLNKIEDTTKSSQKKEILMKKLLKKHDIKPQYICHIPTIMGSMKSF